MSDWEDEPTQKPVVAEVWRGNKGNNGKGLGDDDGGWGNESLTWAQEDRGTRNPDRRNNSSSKRFEDTDGTLWGGGGSGPNFNRQNHSYGNYNRRGRGGRGNGYNDRSSRKDEGIKNNEIGFGYDNNTQNGYAARKFFSSNLEKDNKKNSFNNQANGHYQDRGGKGCYSCGEFGHIARNCRSGSDTRAVGGDGCFKCGEDGHFARECTNSSSGLQSNNRSGGGGYVPREEDDFDVLYKNGISSGINFDR